MNLLGLRLVEALGIVLLRNILVIGVSDAFLIPLLKSARKNAFSQTMYLGCV